MEDMKVNYIRPAILTTLIVLFFASLSQSCGAAKETVGRYVASPRLRDPNRFKWGLKPFLVTKPIKSFAQENPPVEDQPKAPVIQPAVIPKDTSPDYSKLILENQKKGLSNDELIISLLRQKDAENNRLKNQNKGLSKKSVISDKIKNDAVGLQAIWDMGKVIVVVGLVVISLLIGQIAITLVRLKRKQVRLGH